MMRLSGLLPRPVRPPGRATALGRILRGTLYLKLGLALVLGVAVGLFYLRLSAGPLSFDGLAGRVSQAIAERVGPGWSVAISDSAIELDEGALSLRTTNLDIRNPAGRLIVHAPHAIVSVDTGSLLTGALQPRAIEFRDLQLNVVVQRDGTLAFVPGGEVETAPATAPEPAADPARLSPLAAAVAALFDLAFEPSGVVGVLDRARIANARLRIVDEDRRERASFTKLDATFERPSADQRSFSVSLDGPQGRWRLAGEVRRDAEGRRQGTLTAADVPVRDLLLLSGLSGAPGTADLKLTVTLDAATAAGQLTRLDGRVDAGRGIVTIDDKDMPPIDVEGAGAEASWNEGAKRLDLKGVTFRSAGTAIRLGGTLTAAPGEPWRLQLTGRNAVLRGAEPADPPVAIETIEAVAVERDGGVAVERLRLAGPALDALVTAGFGAPGDPKALEVTVRSRGTDVRTALRLWPNAVVPNVRRYLLQNLRAGRIRDLGIAVTLTGGELVGATSGQPVPDAAVRVDLAIDDAVLAVAEGLPPLTGLRVAGTVTGTRADLRAETAAIEIEGRTIALSEGAFAIPEIWTPPSTAKVGFRLGGGADGLVALLRTPLLKEASGNLDIEPGQAKGRADLRVALELPVNAMPAFADLPLGVSGTIANLTIDRVFGKEKLENAQLAVAYDRGSLSIKGEGRIGGAPSTIEVRQPRAGPGEVLVAFALDEAGRARRGLAVGAAVTGSMPVRVSVPLGRGDKAGARVDIDLARIGIDNLLPGWSKPAGRPGRLAFVVADRDIRDIVLDSGSVAMRGSAQLSADGQIERADLTSFKLSPGDDARVQVERRDGVYRASVKGNFIDAKPFIRNLMSASSGGPKEQRDVDIELAANILAGFNDEVLTGATLKASLRGKDIRQLQLGGRFRVAPVSAVVSRAERGAPVLTLQSQDAGATLRYFDLYRRMVGGDVTLQLGLNDGPQRGKVTINGFALKNEPALRRIVSQQPQAAMAEDRAAAQPPAFDPNAVEFIKLEADFTRSASRLEFRDATMYGSQVGFTIGGWLDQARDRADISGTFVPAYGLNNAFAQVPLFGPILGGGPNEGLFAVNFRIAGAASAPTLTINPLSAVAPGFLRKLFGAGGAASDATGATPPPRQER